MPDRREQTNDPTIAFRGAFSGDRASLWTALPGFVTAWDSVKNVVEVQPTIQAQITDPQLNTKWVNLPKLLDCPVVFPAAGGFTITLPIAVGDEVLVVFASRCIDSWWQSGGIAIQAEFRMHDLSDGFAIPGPRSRGKVIGGISQTNAEIRNDANSCAVSLAPDGSISLRATQITANCPITATDFKTPTLPSYQTHTHGGVQSGGSQTTAPTSGT